MKVKVISTIFIFPGILLVLLAFGPLIFSEIWYAVKSWKGQDYVLDSSVRMNAERRSTVFGRYLPEIPDSAFESLLTKNPIIVTPVDTNFTLVVEKIGLNVPVVRDVSVTNERAYREALKDGVAHSLTSPYPSDKPGNVYLFAHASVNFWELGRFAQAFNLLRKLEVGDKAHIFYEGGHYVYSVVNKEVMKGWNTYPLTRPVIEPTLTLQTCDPPGTTFNRLVVTANLIEVRAQ